jgi:hypothetical protein
MYPELKPGAIQINFRVIQQITIYSIIPLDLPHHTQDEKFFAPTPSPLF